LNLDVFLSIGPAVEDLAREAWLMERAAEGRISVFLTSWEEPAVVLGYAQKEEEVDLEFCRAERMSVLRRLTGGTGVIHRGDLGVGVALPAEHSWAKGIVGLYDRFLDVLEPALRSLGSEVSRLAERPHASRVRSPICFVFGVEEEEVRKGLAPALPGADWRLVGDAIVEGLAGTLELEARRQPLEPLPERFLEPYRTPRWSPASNGRVGGIPNS
jgi:hypothetical protein